MQAQRKIGCTSTLKDFIENALQNPNLNLRNFAALSTILTNEFVALDPRDCGFITQVDWEGILTDKDEDLGDEEIKTILRDVEVKSDENKNPLVNYKEFLEVLQTVYNTP